MPPIYKSYNTFENLTGICSGSTGQGIFINLPTQTILSNSFGYNTSPTGSTSANGILAAGYGSSNVDLIKLNNCEGKSFAGNGISVTNGVLNNCIGTVAGSTSITYYSFIGTATTIFNNCESRVGSKVDPPLYLSYPLQLKSISGSGYVNASKINNCSFKSPNEYCIVVSSSAYESIDISDSTISSDILFTGTPLSLPVGCTTLINIDNCSISGYFGVEVGYGSSINNNSIAVGDSSAYWLNATTSPSIVEYSNNIISGSPSLNSGVDFSISQGIPINTNVDNYGNMVYQQRSYPGLVGYWDLGNTSSYLGAGTALNDVSLLGINDATIVNATYNSSNGGYLSFDGAGDYAFTSAGGTSLILTSAITIEAFINVTSFAGDGNICCRSQNPGYRLRVNSSGRLNFLAGSGVVPFINYQSSITVPTNTWIHVVATHGPTGGVLYQNTVVGATSGLAFGATSALSGLLIGVFSLGSGEYFNGKIGLLRIYNRVLSLDEVRRNYLADRKRFGL